MLREVVVSGADGYRVLVGPVARQELGGLIPGNASKVVVITSSAQEAPARTIAQSLDAHVIEIPDSEAGKSAETLQSCWRQLGELGVNRNDVLVTVGGGATTDLGGFVAATWLRGIAVVHVPTTLLGMVDAAVGGKTGINTDAGKNLVGAFHQPSGVVCDLDFLQTLAPEEFQQGLAEVVKCGLIADAEILRLFDSQTAESIRSAPDLLQELVVRAVQVKADVVSQDFKERSDLKGGNADEVGREALNYGHTLGHAIERRERYLWRHGNAISVGMAFVAEVALRLDLLSKADRDLHFSVLEGLGLPTSYDREAWPELRSAMELDKKSRGAQLRLVLLSGLQHPVVVAAPPEDVLQSAFEALST